MRMAISDVCGASASMCNGKSERVKVVRAPGGEREQAAMRGESAIKKIYPKRFTKKIEMR